MLNTPPPMQDLLTVEQFESACAYVDRENANIERANKKADQQV